MLRRANFLVRAVLPALPLLLCQACGGGSTETTQTAPGAGNPETPPASPNKAPTINGVGDEYAKVGETYTIRVASHDHLPIRIDGKAQPEPLRGGGRTHGVGGADHGGRQIDLVALDLQLTGDDA